MFGGNAIEVYFGRVVVQLEARFGVTGSTGVLEVSRVIDGGGVAESLSIKLSRMTRVKTQMADRVELP